MKQNLADRNAVKPPDAKMLELKEEHWQLMSDLLPVLHPLRCEGGGGGGGDRRPDLAPFPANDGTPSPPADDRHSGRWCAQNGRGEGTEGARSGNQGSAMATGPRAGESSPPVGCHWTIG